MFQCARGVTIPFPDRIKEEYEVFPEDLTFQPSFEKIRPMLLDFIEEAQAPFFLALHLPLSEQEEQKLRPDENAPFHQRICYLDGQTREQLLTILSRFGEILLHDGMTEFAVASHNTHEEFFVRRYKLIQLYSPQPNKWEPLMAKYGIKKTDKLVTVWDTFSKEHPGTCCRYEKDGLDVYAVYQELIRYGMYEAKIVEE